MNDQKENPFSEMGEETTAGELIDAFMKQAEIGDTISPVSKAMGVMQKQYEVLMEHLQQTMVGMRSQATHNSMYIDVLRLTSSLLANILIDKGIVTQEEWEERNQKEVHDEMDRHVTEMQKAQKKHMAQQETEAQNIQETEPNVPSKPSEPAKKIQESESDIVLASERSGKVIKFPNNNNSENR